MDVEVTGLGLAILVACGVALMWLIAFGERQARKGWRNLRPPPRNDPLSGIKISAPFVLRNAGAASAV